MDAVSTAFGLSGAAGLNAWIPLFATGLLERTGAIDVAEPYDKLGSTGVLIVLAVLMLLDLIGDKLPVIDSVLHAGGAVVHPVSGAILFAGEAGLKDVPDVVSLASGAVIAGALHATRATARPVVTGSTAGIGNPVVSLVEDVGSVGLVVLAVIIPVLAFLLVVAALVGVVLVFRSARRRMQTRKNE
ncbi:MAG TPA: DUF4126 domain-containing protein [Solirubrobacteraceae bacterium]